MARMYTAERTLRAQGLPSFGANACRSGARLDHELDAARPAKRW
jgi:hypothetical protein